MARRDLLSKPSKLRTFGSKPVTERKFRAQKALKMTFAKRHKAKTRVRPDPIKDMSTNLIDKLNFRGLHPEDDGEWQMPYQWARPPVGYQNHDLWCGPAPTDVGGRNDTVYLVPVPMWEPTPPRPPSAPDLPLVVTHWCPVTDQMVLQTMPTPDLDIAALQRCASGRNRLRAEVQDLAEAACPWWLPSSIQTCCHPGYTDDQIRRRYAQNLRGPRDPIPSREPQPVRGWEQTPYGWHGGKNRPHEPQKFGRSLLDRIAAADAGVQIPLDTPDTEPLTAEEWAARLAEA
jgi:hypothetical protein